MLKMTKLQVTVLYNELMWSDGTFELNGAYGKNRFYRRNIHM